MGRSVLVTGVARYLGGRVARQLAATAGVDQVIGVDVIAPPHDIGAARFVRADIRNSMIGRIIEQSGVDTVAHLSVIATPLSAGGRTAQKEINVIGTMQLLAACQRAPRLTRLTVKSTSAVYGAGSGDPAVFTETMTGTRPPRGGWGKDSAEVEEYVRSFGRRRPDVAVATLRPANVIGPGIRTSMTDYFSLPVVPSVLGFDPRLQFLHEDDAVEALCLATLGDAVGVINVAGDGVLTLSQAAGLAGRPTLALPARAAELMGNVYRRGGLADFSADQIRYLSFGRCLDTTRMRADLGLEPAYSTRTAFEDFVRTRGLRGPLSPQVVNAVEHRLVSWLRPEAAAHRRPPAAPVRPEAAQ